MNNFLQQEIIEQKIYLIRGLKVMFDHDLAKLYQVPTKRLNEQVKRNIERFPSDFMFQITPEEFTDLRSHFATSKQGGRQYLPLAFTEQGVAMLSGVLKSKRAVQVNVAIMRTFVKLRQILATHKELAKKIKDLEKLIGSHDRQIQSIFQVLKTLTVPPEKPARRIEFLQGDNLSSG